MDRALHSDAIGEVPVLRCTGCDGVWVSRPAFADLRTDLDGWERVLASERQDIRWEEKVVYLRCLDCDGLMRRTNFGGQSGVVVDHCDRHGIWFDAGELFQAVAFLRHRLIASGQSGETGRPVEPGAARAAPAGAGHSAPPWIEREPLLDGHDLLELASGMIFGILELLSDWSS